MRDVHGCLRLTREQTMSNEEHRVKSDGIMPKLSENLDTWKYFQHDTTWSIASRKYLPLPSHGWQFAPSAASRLNVTTWCATTVEKGKYVQFTDVELDTIEAEANSNIELKEFIPIEKVDPVYFKGLSIWRQTRAPRKPTGCSPMRWKSKRVALAEMVSRGKEKFGADPAVEGRVNTPDDVLRR